MTSRALPGSHADEIGCAEVVELSHSVLDVGGSLVALVRLHVRDATSGREQLRLKTFPLPLDRGMSSDRSTSDFTLTVDHGDRSVKFGPRGWIMVQGVPRGRGLGGYLLSELVTWAQGKGWNAYSVRPVTLSRTDQKLGGDATRGQENENENGTRRDAMYRSIGLKVVVDADGDGAATAPNVGALHPRQGTPKVRRVRLHELVRGREAASAKALASVQADLRNARVRLVARWGGTVVLGVLAVGGIALSLSLGGVLPESLARAVGGWVRAQR